MEVRVARLLKLLEGLVDLAVEGAVGLALLQLDRGRGPVDRDLEARRPVGVGRDLERRVALERAPGLAAGLALAGCGLGVRRGRRVRPSAHPGLVRLLVPRVLRWVSGLATLLLRPAVAARHGVLRIILATTAGATLVLVAEALSAVGATRPARRRAAVRSLAAAFLESAQLVLRPSRRLSRRSGALLARDALLEYFGICRAKRQAWDVDKQPALAGRGTRNRLDARALPLAGLHRSLGVLDLGARERVRYEQDPLVRRCHLVDRDDRRVRVRRRVGLRDNVHRRCVAIDRDDVVGEEHEAEDRLEDLRIALPLLVRHDGVGGVEQVDRGPDERHRVVAHRAERDPARLRLGGRRPFRMHDRSSRCTLGRRPATSRATAAFPASRWSAITCVGRTAARRVAPPAKGEPLPLAGSTPGRVAPPSKLEPPPIAGSTPAWAVGVASFGACSRAAVATASLLTLECSAGAAPDGRPIPLPNRADPVARTGVGRGSTRQEVLQPAVAGMNELDRVA